ncbi:uncharacterized protein LOC143034882 [Oratosquilla oratoria]|uniref:uncharacterized protein LOC143034882 n=1 Tax=Oratosquilla oratoria TaxID=337810 RepID=UPI003F7579D1
MTQTSVDQTSVAQTDFIERLKELNLNRGDVLVSFDVQSVFTSIPRELAKRALKSAMEGNPGFLAYQKLSLSELMGLLSLCLDLTYFRFRDYTYHQRKGTPMGSPISVVVAEIVMQRLEAQLLSAAPSFLKLWTRYMDDVFAILDSKNVEPFFSHINSIEPPIQFSIELEIDQLPFLGVYVKCEGDTPRTSVYRKPKHTDRLLDYDSYYPDRHQRSVIRTLWNRVGKVCSTVESKNAEKKHILQVFRNNGYPSRIIRKWTKTRRTDTPEQRPHTTLRATIPYIKGASEVTARVLRDNGVQVEHKTLNTLQRNLTKNTYNGTTFDLVITDKARLLGRSKHTIMCGQHLAHYVLELDKF